MPIILETSDFIVKAHDKPHHDRDNGGHVVVETKQHFTHLHEMPVNLVTSLMQLVALTEKAVLTVMKAQGIDVVRANIQMNGNWAYKDTAQVQPSVHVHLYIRSWNEKHPTNDARFQAFPEAIFNGPRESGFYDTFKPLTEDDCEKIKQQLSTLISESTLRF